jgi:hypothetical protein
MRLRKSAAVDLGRRLVRREVVDGGLDLLRLRLDTFPRGLYQPVASLPLNAATRADGCESRWAAMVPVLDRVRPATAVDVGASAGFFSIRLGERGIVTTAIEASPPSQRIAMLAVRRSGLRNVGVLAAALEPGTMALMPPADCVLHLSVWHHLVRDHGLAAATAMLSQAWERTGSVLFFDTGQGEMPREFGLPQMGADERAWLARKLEETCPGGSVEHLGRHAAFDAAGRPCRRDLFAVVRRPG